MTATHTPGPWRTDTGSHRDLCRIVTAASRPHGSRLKTSAGPISEVHDVIGWASDSIPGGEANARLIAAAPELLAALRQLVPIVSAYCSATNDDVSAVSLRFARAAIAKATGGAP